MPFLDHPIGIHFGLPEADYRADRGLGYSDKKRLSRNPQDFWFERMGENKREKKPTPSQIYGTAQHKLSFEGMAAFEARYGVKMLNWSTKSGKDEKAYFEESGRIPIDEEDWNRIVETGMILQRDPELRDYFVVPIGSEVSIFWERNGIKQKARLDNLLVSATVDLKTITNDSDISFEDGCIRAISRWSYHMQWRHYLDARMSMADAVKKGRVYYHDSRQAICNAKMLDEAARNRKVAFVIIFVQSNGAPITWGWQISPDNPVMDAAQMRLMRAERNYRKYMEKFGPDVPWLVSRKIQEFDMDAMPVWWLREAEAARFDKDGTD